MKQITAILVGVFIFAPFGANAAGLQINIDIPVVHGGFNVDIGKGIAVSATLPIVGGGAEASVFTPTDNISAGVTLPVVEKRVVVGCCQNMEPYSKE